MREARELADDIERRLDRLGEPLAQRELRIVGGLGEPALFAIVISTLGASVYFALGFVAGDALGLTPIAFLVAAGFFVITMMTYVEGTSLHIERGGASTFARYAFNELWSFIAGWAILLDYVIVMAIAAVALTHYTEAFWAGTDSGLAQTALVAAAIGFVAFSNVRGLGASGLRGVIRLGLVNIALAVVVIVVGLATFYEPGILFDTVDLGTAPAWDDLVFATVIATVAVTGIEAASGLAGEIRVGRRRLRRFVALATLATVVVLAGMSFAGLSALPVEGGTTDLGEGGAVEAPVLGFVAAYEPAWLADVLRYAVGAVGALVLLAAVNVNMLGVSRLTYALATNRQVPSVAGRLHPRRATPWVAIVAAGMLAFVLAESTGDDLEFLLGLYAFGAMLAFTLAHLSIVVLRFREPDARRAYRVPLGVRLAGRLVPLPAVAGTLLAAAAWISVVILHEGARVAGGVWLAGGLTLYLVYRRSQGKSLAKRFTIPEEALRDTPDTEYQSILVPVFGNELDEHIVGTAGRLAAEEWEKGEGGPMIEALYVIEVPMSLPFDAVLPEARLTAARSALAHAKEVGEEYRHVEVATSTRRARSIGAGIVQEAKRRGVNAIVMAAEPPTRIKGGTRLGGLGGPNDRSLGEVTRYVVEKAPCRVLLTAPGPGDKPGRRAPDGGDASQRAS